ncbi:riboflavin synthase [uncultured Paludibaculum sp.]|uniref:riboflavin synthase n=1 Tax=uncultured Paludibaculum sp. TaxID=1765020 RepID=UPI002AAAD4CB|nr:riboflavin synthase [uncultured Paludibaculum sp.]
MFTGIIEELGRVEAIEPRSTGSRLRIRAPLVCSDAKEGDSICVSGVCLTAVALRPGSFGADVSPETLTRTSLKLVKVGAAVNLERALLPTTRLGGHIVQGHVDGVGEIVSVDLLGDDNWLLKVRAPKELDRYLAFKGSVAIDGISLTVAAIENCEISVAVIPHTYAHTTLTQRKPGDPVNLETDVLAKYVEKMLGKLDLKGPSLTIEGLLQQGY